MKRKSISMEKQPQIRPKSKKPRESRGPRKDLSYEENGLCSDKEVRTSVRIALSSWNEQSLSNKGPEYELVDRLGCTRVLCPTVYHCNFIARPKNGSEDEDMLFFGEVLYQTSKGGLYCHVCSILGPSGTVTGLSGCRICKLHPRLVQHPEDGFIKIPYYVTAAKDDDSDDHELSN